eukprot:5294875-Amphidinium_carterae.2
MMRVFGETLSGMGSVSISREFMTIPSRARRRSPLPMMEKWTPRSVHQTAQQIRSSLSQTFCWADVKSPLLLVKR